MRIAVLLSGQLRSAAFCFPSLRRHVLDRLGPCDIFAHIADDADVSLVSRLNPRALVVVNAPAFDEKDYRSHAGHDFGAAPEDVQRLLAQLWRLEQSNRLRLEAEHADGARYDWVLRVRPDTLYHTDIEDLGGLDPAYVYLPTFGNFHGYNDRFAFGGAAVMDVYHARLGEPLDTYLAAGGVLHPECILRGILDRADIPVRRTGVIFDTLRPNGTRLALTWSHHYGDVIPDFLPEWRRAPVLVA